MLTTRDAVSLEQRIIAGVEDGRGAAPAMVSPDLAGPRLQALSQIKYGLTLNAGQEGAGRLLLGSNNRIVAIQGVAGAGKSTVLKPVADILREEGRAVLGLAVQNTLVQMLERDTGIPSMTVSRFLARHRGLLEGAEAARLAEARADMRGSVVLLDEASMVGNADKEKLVRLANLLELGRFASIGDRKQLGAVDAGKPFDVMQQAGIETAVMNTNLRARSEVLRDAQQAAQEGRIEDAMRHLAPQVIEVGNDAAVEAAAAWLSLSSAAREATAIYASGRNLRSAVNDAVQTGLRRTATLCIADLDENGNPYPGGPISRAFLRDEADAALGFTSDLSLWILATTARRDTKVQAWVEEINDEWARAGRNRIAIVWTWDECISHLNSYPDLQHRYYRDVIQVRAPKDLDEIILRTIAMAFARPAFEVPLHCETPSEFFQALKDTQKALRTGELVDRESRQVIRKAIGGYHELDDIVARNGLREVDQNLKLLRTQLERGLKDGTIVAVGTCLDLRQPALVRYLDDLRQRCLDDLNRVLGHAGIPPI